MYLIKLSTKVIIFFTYNEELYQRSLKHIVRQEFDIFSADKTGKTDYALEATG